jgi:hypothetical protein
MSIHRSRNALITDYIPNNHVLEHVQENPHLEECLYISVVAESTLICLLLDVLDGRWLFSILFSAGMATRSLTILKRRPISP